MSDAIAGRARDRSWGSINLAVAVTYVALACLGNAAGVVLFDHLTLFWPSSGLALAAALYLGHRAWPGVFLGSLIGNIVMLHDGSFVQSLVINTAIGLGSALQAVGGGLVLRKLCRGESPLAHPFNVLKLVATALVSSIVTAAVATPVLAAAGLVRSEDLLGFASTWWLGEATGMLVITPLVVAWVDTRFPERASWAEALLLFGACLAVGQIVFGPFGARSHAFPIVHLVTPLFVWSILRFGPRGVTTLGFVVYTIAMIATARGRGPFAIGSDLASVTLVQLFICTYALGTLTLASMLNARDRAEEALRAARRELEERVDLRTRQLSDASGRLDHERSLGAAVLDLAGALVLVLDGAGRIVRFNRACEELSGRSFTELQGTFASELFSGPASDDALDREVARLLEGGPPRQLETTCVDRAGQKRAIAWTEGTLPGAEGRPELVILSGLDVTDRKRSEDARAHALDVEREARVEAQKSVQLRDDFISIASHELRTPLTPLKLNTEILRLQFDRVSHACTTARAEAFRKLLDNIQREINRMLGLIEGLLDVSRITGGRLVLREDRVDLTALVRDVAERFAPQLETARCELRITAASGPVEGTWDRERLEQVFTNLLTNAIKYASGKPIEVCTELRGRTAQLVVRDHGIGIDEHDRERIFDRFERAAPINHYGGLGLGLYITRAIVLAHGGSIDVDSAPGGGSIFRVRLPTTLTRGEHAPTLVPPRSAGASGEVHR